MRALPPPWWHPLPRSRAKAAEESKTFILVHGTWLGDWVWKDVRRILERAGHDVYTPSLTRCGDRAHLISPDVGLETHIRDIAKIIDEIAKP